MRVCVRRLATKLTRTVTSSERASFTSDHDSLIPRVTAESDVCAVHATDRKRSRRACATDAACALFLDAVMSVMTFADVATIASAQTEKIINATSSSTRV